MVRPRRSLRALAGVAVAGAALTAVGCAPADAHTGAARTVLRAAAPAKAGAEALAVTIDHLMPAYLPAEGVIRVSGTITNTSDEPWSNIRVYAFAGQHELDDGTVVPDEPMVNGAQLAKAAEVPAEAYVGERILPDDSDYPRFAHLAPGQTVSYHLKVPADRIVAHHAGVYWFGVHALGSSASSPEDGNADGRARTLLPLVPGRVSDVQPALPVALVLPLTRPVSYDPDGAVTDPRNWARGLARGRLHDVVDFGAAAGTSPVTWLVDPALPDAVAHLAAGNAPLSIATPQSGQPDDADPTASAGPSASSSTPAARPTGTGTATASATPGGTPSGTATATPAPPTDPVLASAAKAANGWLGDFAAATTDDQVLALPYGDFDVAGALHSPDRDDQALVATATGLTSTELDALGITTTPAFASPRGYLDRDTIAAASDDTTVLASDEMFPQRTPDVLQVAGHRVLVTSSGAAAGGPGPEPAVSAVALRQRILAEAAVRLLKPDPQPLVVVLPTQWSLADGEEFFAGLQASWLDLESVSDATGDATATSVADDDLTYPPLQAHRENDPETYAAIRALISDGQTLQNLLTDRSSIADDVTRLAVGGASYAVRDDQALARVWLTGVQGWVRENLASVDISAPRGVTLSSAAGKFAATLTNRLDETVTVAVSARSDAGITIGSSRSVVLGPHSHTTVLLEARATTNKVHNVTLMVTDSAGTPTGATDELPIRSAQVSQVIWLIMGSGVAILFLAILVRLVRRFRDSRRTRRSALGAT